MEINNSYLDLLGISNEDFSNIIIENPSLKGIVSGYVAEFMLKKLYFSNNSDITSIFKADDHNRINKCDLNVNYKGKQFKIECKSLQSNSVEYESGIYSGYYQCDASDCREILLPNGNIVKTTCLKTGGFDILAINLFSFNTGWKFAFINNSDLPRTTHKKYLDIDKQYLLSTSNKIKYPLEYPYVDSPFILMDSTKTI